MENKNCLDHIQLSNPMIVGEGEVRTYENKQISIKGEMTVEGELQLKNCIIDAMDTRIKVNGKFSMEGCEVHQPSSEFLQIESEAEATLQESVFYCSLPFHDSVIIARGNEGFLIQKCKFFGEPTVISMLLERNGRSVQPFEVPLVDANMGRIMDCQFENFTGCRVVNVLSLVGTVFENCHRIEVGGSGEKTRVAKCHFTNCKEINVYDCAMECCVFRNIETMFANLTRIRGCNFFDLKCSFDHIICLDDSTMENCRFNGVELMEDTYLIDATSESSLTHCKFENCRTSREDRELIRCEEMQGILFKKRVGFDIVDHDTCTGLDLVGILA